MFVLLLLLCTAASVKFVAGIIVYGKSISLAGNQSLVQIDSFVLQGKAEYLTSGAKGAVNGVSFTSTDGYRFFIRDVAWEGITENIELRELLKRHGLKFIAFADQETYEQYTTNRLFRFIEVKQIQIGAKKYIDHEKGQLKYSQKIKWKMLTDFMLVVLIYFFTYRHWISTTTRRAD